MQLNGIDQHGKYFIDIRCSYQLKRESQFYFKHNNTLLLLEKCGHIKNVLGTFVVFARV